MGLSIIKLYEVIVLSDTSREKRKQPPTVVQYKEKCGVWSEIYLIALCSLLHLFLLFIFTMRSAGAPGTIV